MALHPWWAAFGLPVPSADALSTPSGRAFAKAAEAGGLAGIKLIECRHAPETGRDGVYVEVEVERPQILEHPIRGVEPIAVIFLPGNARPRVLSLREDFPDTMHQNEVPTGAPCSLCVDDRPWPEAQLTYTPFDLARQVQTWLAKAARGALHDPAQPPDPLFYASPLSLVLPSTALSEQGQSAEFAGLMKNDNGGLIIARPLSEAPQGVIAFSVMAFALPPQSMTRMRSAPVTVAGLAAELERCGVLLLDAIKSRILEWAHIEGETVRRMSSRLVIVIGTPVSAGTGRTVNDFRAFVTYETGAEIGIGLGIIHKNTTGPGYVRAILSSPTIGHVSKIEPTQVHFAFDRKLAAAIAGRPGTDAIKAVLVGAGSLGSQLALDLVREGRFTFTPVDGEILLPHNMARHGLLANEIGSPKAPALARQIGALLNEPCASIIADVLDPGPDAAEALTKAYSGADVIIDASASVGVSRHLSDVAESKARRICAFFNPAGTSVVVLAESVDRATTLRDLEAQYHRLVLTTPELEHHLHTGEAGVRYSGSCRALTNRIPATRAAILSGLAALGVEACLENPNAAIRVSTLGADGSVSVFNCLGLPVQRTTIDGWSVSYDEGLLQRLAELRAEKLPNETGGVLLGIADMSRMAIQIAHALPQPADSDGTPSRFERGVADLVQDIDRAADRTMHQVRYIGEWHSHPDFVSSRPSGIDLAQIAWLGSEIADEGLPGLMAIAASNGDFAFVGYDPAKSRLPGLIKVSIRHASL